MLSQIQRGRDHALVYRLWFSAPYLTITLSPAAMAYLKERLPQISPGNPKVDEEIKAELPEFIPPTEEAWGFGPILWTQEGVSKRIPAEELLPGWFSLTCELPKVTKDAPVGLMDWNMASGWAVSATLDNVFRCLLYGDDLGDPAGQQGLAIENMYCSTRNGSLASPIGAFLSPWFLDRIFGRYDETGDGIERHTAQDVYRAYTRMQSYRELPDYEARQFTVRLDPEFKSIYIGCSGDRAGLHPADFNHPHRLSCHNVDNPVQQLSLLAGLAHLDQIAPSRYLDP